MSGAITTIGQNGDTSEQIAQFVLSRFAAVVRVPWHQDVGNDLLCTIVTPQGPHLLRASTVFTVQVKSNNDPIVFAEDHERAWLTTLGVPFFVCVVDRAELKVRVYSTWNRLLGHLARRARRIRLLPENARNWPQPTTIEDEPRGDSAARQDIPLGEPILVMTLPAAMDERLIEEYRACLESWADMDRRNIAAVARQIHSIEGPERQGQGPPAAAALDRHFYWNANNVQTAVRNFGHAAFELGATLANHPQSQVGDLDTIEQALVALATSIPELQQPLQLLRHARQRAGR